MSDATQLESVEQRSGPVVAKATDINSADFWDLWARNGGDVDAYVKETIPNYGLIGALLLTITLDCVLNPPAFTMDDPIDGDEWYVNGFVFLCTTSSFTSVAMILYSTHLYTQFVNCVSTETKIQFCNKFGYIVSILTFLLIADFVSLLLAYIFVLMATYDDEATKWCATLVLLGGLLAVVCHLCYITNWNVNHNYGPALAQAQAGEKARQEERREA